MKLFVYALVAQLDRVSDYESEGQGFESLQARHGGFAVVKTRFHFIVGARFVLSCMLN